VRTHGFSEEIEGLSWTDKINPATSLLSVILIASLATILYYNSLAVPFQFDDYPGIVQNTNIRTLGNIKGITYSSHPPRPLFMFTFALNYWWGHLDPTGYHVVNDLIHLLNGILIFLIVRWLFKLPALRDRHSPRQAMFVALVSALFFVSHPVHTEAVTYIWGRSDSLSTLFYLLTLWCFIKASYGNTQLPPEENRKTVQAEDYYYHGSLFFFILGLGTKEIPISFPALLLVLHYCFIAEGKFKEEFKRAIRSTAPFFLVAVARVVLFFTPLGETLFPRPETHSPYNLALPWPDGLNRYTNILTQSRAVVRYVGILLFPTSLNADHDFPISHSILDPSVMLAMGFLVLLVAMAVLFFRRSPVAAFGIIWFLLNLGLFFVIPLRDTLVERRLYLPSIGFCILMAVAVSALSRIQVPRCPPKVVRRLAVAVPVIVIFLLSAATIKRNEVWGSQYRLWSDTVAKSPHKARPRLSLSAAYANRQAYDQAINEIKGAIRLQPRYGRARQRLLALYCSRGLFDQAAREFKDALKATPGHAALWYIERQDSLSRQQDAFNRAVLEVENDVTANSSDPDVHVALGLIFLRVVKDRQKALFYLTEGLKGELDHFQESEIEETVSKLGSRPPR
jgi:tetratricopeptide (TPR) repeat protein